MESEIISKIIYHLNQLLAEDLDPHAISYQFEKIAVQLNKEKVHIDKSDCKEYYDDGDLSLILLMKNEALSNAQFELASKFRIIEKELIVEKGNSSFTQIKTEPFYFEYRNTSIIFHYDKGKENQRLIANLIEGYNLIHHKSGYHKILTY